MSILDRLGSQRRALVIIAVAANGGLALNALGVPAGAILGALGATLALNIARPGDRLPKFYRQLGKGLVGIAVGSTIEPAMLGVVAGAFGPILLGVVALTTIGMGIGLTLHRAFGWDLATALYSCTPGGLSELAVASEDAGARQHVVIAVHTMRVATIVVLGPPILALLVGLAR
jgi:uncharacterized protein